MRDLAHANNLYQVIDEFTHITPYSSSLLDLIITDAPGYILYSGTLPPTGDKYHCGIYCKVNIQLPKERDIQETFGTTRKTTLLPYLTAHQMLHRDQSKS